MLKDLRWDVPVKAPVKPSTPQEALLAAAKFIEDHGWSARGYEQDDDRYCPIEAIVAVARNYLLQRAAIDLLKIYVQHIEPIGITYWNARASEDEVVAAMREAAQVGGVNGLAR